MPILNFGTIRPANLAEWLNSYISLPIFSYSGIPWKGASEIVTQFNYTATKNFTLRELPTPPVGVNFCLVIRYRIGMTSYRYKLWSAVGEVLNEPLYNGQIIKKNFVLEIWTVQNNTNVSLTSAINIKTSIRKIPDTYALLDEYADNTVVQEAASQNIIVASAAVPTTGLLAHYKNENIVNTGAAVTSWTDSVGGFNLGVFAGVTEYVSNALFGYKGARFNGVGILQALNPFTSLGGPGDDLVFAVCKQNNWVDTHRIFGVINPGASDIQGVNQKGVSPEIRAIMQATYSAANNLLPIGNYDVIKYKGDLFNAIGYVSILGNNEVNTGAVGGTTQGTNFRVGEADVTMLEILCYNGDLMLDHDSVYAYLLSKFGLGITIPMTVNDANPWLSN